MAMVYPFKKYNYDVTIDGKAVGGFSEVSAPDISSDPIEYREGNFAVNTVGKQPGLGGHRGKLATGSRALHASQ